VTPSKLKSGALGVLTQGAQAGAQAALDGKGLGAAAGAAGDALESGAEGLGASLGAGLSGVFPTQAQFQGELDAIQGDLDSIIPTQDTLSKGLTGGADVLTGGLYSSLKGKNYSQALDQAIDMFFVGSITRSAEKQIFKMVGGAFITVAVPAIRWDAGFGYLETVGGVKLTAVLGHIETTSDGILVTTVGGAAIRSSLGETGIHTVTSSINVGGMMGIFGGERIEIRGATVKLSADVALLVSAGGASILMTPSAIEISGNVALEGGTAVKTAGEVFITK
jgi:hypothetical protein